MSDTPQTALVTGGSGFIGSHVAEELCARGYHVRCFFRRSSSLQWIQHLPVDIFYGDLDDPDSLLPAVENADVVFHVAGVVKTVRPSEFYTHNTEGTEHLVRAALAAAPRLKRFTFVSSQAAAGPAERLDKPCQPDDPCHPVSDYGTSKVLAEQCLKQAGDRIPFTIIRPPGVYGPRDSETLLFLKAVQRGFAVIPGFRARYINLIFTKDLARAIVDASEAPRAAGNTYFLTDGVNYSYQELYRHIGAALGVPYRTIHLPIAAAWLPAVFAELVALIRHTPSQLTRQKLREASRRFWVCSAETARRDFGFSCRFDFPAGLNETVAWYRSQGWL